MYFCFLRFPDVDNSYNSAHHVQFSDSVIVVIQEPEFIQQMGFVVGFHPGNQRFLVLLKGGSSPSTVSELELRLKDIRNFHYFEGRNLTTINRLGKIRKARTDTEHKVISFTALIQVQNFEQLWVMGPSIDEIFFRSTGTDLEFVFCSTWLKKVSRFTTDPTVSEECLARLSLWLENSAEILPEYVCELKIAEATFLKNIGERKKAMEILKSLVESHFGNLPQITTLLLELLRNDKSESHFCSDLLCKTQSLIDAGNYSNRNFAFDALYEYLTAEFFYMAMFLSTHDRHENELYVQFLEIHQLATSCEKWARQKSEKTDIPEIIFRVERNNSNYLQREALLLIHKEQYKEALKSATEAQRIECKCEGMLSRNMSRILELKLCCYIFIGDKKKGKKTLKRLKRSLRREWSAENDKIVSYETIIRSMKDTQTADEPLKTYERCSNPFCSNVESKRSQFKVCGGCRSVKYCNRFAPSCETK